MVFNDIYGNINRQITIFGQGQNDITFVNHDNCTNKAAFTPNPVLHSMLQHVAAKTMQI